MPRPLVFDLDKTLIHEAAFDWGHWVGRIAVALGRPVPADLDWASLPIHTDHGLVNSLSEAWRGRALTVEERDRYEAALLQGFEALLGEPANRFQPIDGAPELLAAVSGRAGLATGNIHAITMLKLRSAGIDRPAVPCSCSKPGIDRAELVRRALLAVGWTPGSPATSVGDGVWDVRAARELGVGFVGVAQSDAHEARLRAAGARLVVRDYRDQSGILAMLDEAGPPEA
jgi:phosphoglycolate phosphatase-like HAD superfamily hydrolase